MKTANKRCPKCHNEYPATPEYFNRNENTPDGLFRWCKKCKKESDDKYRQTNIEAINKRRKEWRKNNKAITKERDRLYRKKMKSRMPEEIIVPDTKKCRCCDKTKVSQEFFKDAILKGGLSAYCKECTKTNNKKSYHKHKKKRAVSGKEYREKNKDKIFKRQQIYYKKNKERIQAYKKEYQQKNSEIIAEKQKLWGQIHRKQINQYSRDRRKNDLHYRILNNMRGRLYYALKAQGSRKALHTMDLVGCSIDELKLYIQKQFATGMTWDNYGLGNIKWSIDHIIPCAYFDLTNLEEQKKCFHYTNLCPLWNKDNSKKNSLYNGQYIRKERKINYV